MSGVELIAAERARQIAAEGWTPEHDDEHTGCELTKAAICYAEHAAGYRWPINPFPWDDDWWKPDASQIRNLVKAGALIAAEIDRLERARAADR